MDYLSKKCSFIVSYDEVDFLGRLKPSAMLQYFQDGVEVHAYDLKITHKEMEEKGKFWVLSRIFTHINAYPKVGDTLSLVTYPHKPGLAEAFRSFLIYNEKGELLVSAISKWCVLDMKTKRICRCGDLFDFPDEAFYPDKAVEFPLKKLSNNRVSKEEIMQHKNKTFRVNITDLDENLHMNNAKYGDVMLNSCDFDELKRRQIEGFDISFLSELKLDDRFVTYLNQTNECSQIDGIMDGKQVFSATVKWKN